MTDKQHIPYEISEESKELGAKVGAVLDFFEDKYPRSLIAMTLVSLGVYVAEKWKKGAGEELLKRSIKAINEMETNER